jgi:hypothetical protein
MSGFHLLEVAIEKAMNDRQAAKFQQLVSRRGRIPFEHAVRADLVLQLQHLFSQPQVE